MKRESTDKMHRIDRRAITALMNGEPPLPMDDISKRRLFDSVIQTVSSSSDVPPLKRHRLKSLVWPSIAVSMAGVATVALVWSLSRESATTVDNATPLVSADRTESAIADRNVHDKADEPDLTRVTEPKSSIDTDGLVEAQNRRMAVKLPSGIALMLAPKTEMRMIEADAGAISVMLLKGRLLASVDPHRKGPPFSVLTKHGSIRVTGTIFSVDTAAKNTAVAVLRGSLETHLSGGRSQALSAGYRQTLGEDAPVKLSESDISAFQSDVFALTDLGRGEDALLDLSRSFNIAAKPDAQIRKLSAESLLKKARQLCIEKRWDEAAAAYQSLIHAYPTDTKSVAALVSLGDLQLRRLHRGEDALRNYDRYLSSGNRVLRQEALLGKADALHALGRVAQEKEILSAYLKQFPNEVQSAAILRRIANIENAPK